MAWLIIIGTLAAWGVFCLLWTLLGWVLPGDDGGILLYLSTSRHSADGAILRHHWLRGLGIIKGPLLLLESNFSPEEQAILHKKYPGIEFCSLEALNSRLELEREQLD